MKIIKRLTNLELFYFPAKRLLNDLNLPGCYRNLSTRMFNSDYPFLCLSNFRNGFNDYLRHRRNGRRVFLGFKVGQC